MDGKQYWVGIIGPVDKEDMPAGFDQIPRRAAIDAIEEHGIKVENCFSGWGCSEEKFKKLMDVWNSPDA